MSVKQKKFFIGLLGFVMIAYAVFCVIMILNYFFYDVRFLFNIGLIMLGIGILVSFMGLISGIIIIVKNRNQNRKNMSKNGDV